MIERDVRLAVSALDGNDKSIFDLDDNFSLISLSMVHDGNSLLASADYRFAVIKNRNNDSIGFIDGARWRSILLR